MLQGSMMLNTQFNSEQSNIDFKGIMFMGMHVHLILSAIRS